MAAEFLVQFGQEPSATLEWNALSYVNYVVVDHDLDATTTENRIRKIHNIQDCFPPLTDNFLAFRTFPKNLAKCFTDPQLRSFLMTGYWIKDVFKFLLKALGFLAVRCFKESLLLDWDPSRIYVSEPPYFRVKGIIKKGGGQNFEEWKNQLSSLYKFIDTSCYPILPGRFLQKKDPEFVEFIALFSKCGNIREVESLLSSWIFWSKFKRMNVIRKFGELYQADFMWPKKLIGKWAAEVVEWEAELSYDRKIKALISVFKAKYTSRPDNTEFYRVEKANNLFLFLRFIQVHFRKHCSALFVDEYQLLAHLDANFPRVMRDVYRACVAIQDEDVFKFDA